jgi:DNA-binding FadR family transcriptional regulator
MVLDEIDPRMHQRLASILASDIVSGRLEVGSDFPAGERLAEIHGVSRTVARETVQALASAGLLSIHHGKRTVVNGVGEWRFLDPLLQRALESERLPEKLLRDLYETRLLLESEAARLCALHGTKELRDRLRASLDAFEDLVDSIEEHRSALLTVTALDRDFHAAIADGSRNVVLARIVRDAHRGLLQSSEPEHLDRALLDSVRRQHVKIARAIDKREPAEAAAAMRGHIQWSLKDTLQARKRAGRR